MIDYDYPLEPEKYVDTIDFPSTPITPTALSSKVMQELKMFGNVIPSKTPQMVEELCKTFNKVIELNKSRNKVQAPNVFPGGKPVKHVPSNDTTSKTFIASPKTGSAKSLSAKMYVAMLQEESSIIVVSTVDDATDTCEHINSERPIADDYARCYYALSAEKKDHLYRVKKNKLKNYKCIVVTHAMFRLANRFQDIDLFSKYKKKKRDLIIIDERINLYTRYTISTDQISDLEKAVAQLIRKDNLNLSSDQKHLQAISTLFAELKKTANDSKTDILLEVKTPRTQSVSNHPFPSSASKPPTQQTTADIVLNKFHFIKLLGFIEDMQYDIPSSTSSVNSKGSRKDSKAIRKTLTEYLKAIDYISYHNCSFYIQGRFNLLMSTDNILNQFGSSVILDATASVNEIYNVSRWHQPNNIELVETTNPRKYDNFTINKAVGFSQGKDVIFKKLHDMDLSRLIGAYIGTIFSIMLPTDKLLIVTHKDFRTEFEEEVTQLGNSSNIEFTHWGNHRGKNLWSDCNKVLIIGWNYLPMIEHYGNYINAVGDLEGTINVTPLYKIKDIKTKFQTTQLADDLVQAIARCSVRKTSSTDGNCVTSEVYMFYPDTKEGKEVMKLIETEFNGAKVKQWNPTLLSYYKKLLKSNENAKKVKDYILNSLKSNSSISQAKVTQHFQFGANKMSRSAIGRVFTGLAFEDMLKAVGIEKYALNQKSNAFRFKV